MLHPTGTRVHSIDSVLRGTPRNGGAGAPEYVKRSWLRCLNEYGLDPDSGADPVVVSRQDLLARKEQNLELVSFADVVTRSFSPIAMAFCSPTTATRASSAQRRAPDSCRVRPGASGTAAPTAWGRACSSGRPSSSTASSTFLPGIGGSRVARRRFSIPAESSLRCWTLPESRIARNSTPWCS